MDIREAIRYMVKGDGYVMTGHRRNLMRGKLKKHGLQTKRGAPRRGGTGMSLVNQILGAPIYSMPVRRQHTFQ